MCKRKGRVIITAACVALAVVAAMVRPHDDEPRYGGRSITQWIDRYHQTDCRTSVERNEVEEAVRHIGTNAIPFFLYSLADSETPAWAERLGRLLERAPLPAGIKTLPYSHRRETRCNCAATAFQILGEQGAPAVPGLTKLLNMTNSFRPHFEAAFALTSVGPKGLPPLLQALTNINYPDHATVLKALRQADLEAETTNVVRAIAQYLESPSPDAAASIQILAELDTGNKDVLDVFARALLSPNEDVRYWAARLLHRFPLAIPKAIPVLQVMATSTNSTLSYIAAETLQDNAPGILTNALIR